MNLYPSIEKKLEELEELEDYLTNSEDKFKELNSPEHKKFIAKDQIYFELRYKFVIWCLKNGATLEQIGCLLNMSKQAIWQLAHYGLTGKVSKTKKKEILERDGYQCQLCHKVGVTLHVHHMHNPKNSLHKNLISLCPKCHRRIHLGMLELPVDNFTKVEKIAIK